MSDPWSIRRQMLSGCVFEFVTIEVDEENAVRKWLRQKITRRNTSDTTGSASYHDVLALFVDHFDAVPLESRISDESIDILAAEDAQIPSCERERKDCQCILSLHKCLVYLDL